MKNHTKVYLNAVYPKWGKEDVFLCEMCYIEEGQEVRCVDVHHIIPRGKGGSVEMDYLENLMGLCRKHHDFCEAGFPKESQIDIHRMFLDAHGIKHDIC